MANGSVGNSSVGKSRGMRLSAYTSGAQRRWLAAVRPGHEPTSPIFTCALEWGKPPRVLGFPLD